MPDTSTRPQPYVSLPVRLFRLFVAVGILVAIMYFTPYLVDAIGPLREYDRVVKETGITPGALYYNDVPQTVDGEFNNRDAIRYRKDASDLP